MGTVLAGCERDAPSSGSGCWGSHRVALGFLLCMAADGFFVAVVIEGHSTQVSWIHVRNTRMGSIAYLMGVFCGEAAVVYLVVRGMTRVRRACVSSCVCGGDWVTILLLAAASHSSSVCRGGMDCLVCQHAGPKRRARRGSRAATRRGGSAEFHSRSHLGRRRRTQTAALVCTATPSYRHIATAPYHQPSHRLLPATTRA